MTMILQQIHALTSPQYVCYSFLQVRSSHWEQRFSAHTKMHYFIIQLQIPTLHLMEMLSNSASNASCLNNFSEIVDWISQFTIFSNFNAFKQQMFHNAYEIFFCISQSPKWLSVPYPFVCASLRFSGMKLNFHNSYFSHKFCHHTFVHTENIFTKNEVSNWNETYRHLIRVRYVCMCNSVCLCAKSYFGEFFHITFEFVFGYRGAAMPWMNDQRKTL